MKKMVNATYHASFLSIKKELGDKFPNQNVFYIVKLSGLHKTKKGTYQFLDKYEVITDRKQVNTNTLEKLGFDVSRTIREITLFIVDRVKKTAKAPEMTYTIHSKGV